MRGLVLAILSLWIAASDARKPYAVHERRDLHTDEWAQREQAEKELFVRARVALAQRNLEKGHDWLLAVSDPSSPEYGKHYSPEEVAELFGPPDNIIQSVTSWLYEEKIRNITLSGNRQWLVFNTKLGDLEKLLDTKFHVYEHSQSGKLSIGCTQYSIPEHLREYIDFVTPGVTMAENLHPALTRTKKSIHQQTGVHKHLPSRSRRTTPEPDNTTPMNCDSTVTPQCIKELYQINDNVSFTPGDGNSVGVYETGSYLRKHDLNKFLAKFEPQFPPNLYPEVLRVDGAPNPLVEGKEFGGLESAIDFQILYPLAYPIPIQLYQVNDQHWEQEPPPGLFNTWLDYLDRTYCNRTAFGITGDSPQYDAVYPDTNTEFPHPWTHPEQCGVAQPSRVLSISFSAGESLVSAAYTRRQCEEFLKLGLQGVTIFGATGDGGVASQEGACLNGENATFAPYGLTNCPYVTAVGSTALVGGAIAGKDPEVASPHGAEFGGSGGGFSNVYKAPEYQRTALETYFANHRPIYPSYKTVNNPTAANVTGKYNRIGRGIPDVAANGQNQALVFGGVLSNAGGGTSASAPLWAGIVARINGARAAAGKSSVGFINPTLYAHPEVFTDIVSGNNPGCNTTGFQCVTGWDPVPGLGTPIYPQLKALFMSL